MESNKTTAEMPEIEQVEFVFLKFGLAQTDEQFEGLIDKYLPYILGKLSSQDANVRTKAIQVLNHISNRLKSRPNVQLPVGKLLELYKQPNSVFIVNFAIVYIKLGYHRLSKDDQGILATKLFDAMEGKSKSHQDIIVRLLVSAFSKVKVPQNPADRSALFKFHQSPSSTKVLLDFCLDVLLMPYSNNASEDGPTRPASAPARTIAVPSGLSEDRVKRLTGDASDSSWSVPQIEQHKVSIINMIAGDIFPEKDIITHLIVATSDTRSSVSSLADIELRKRQRSLDWDEPTLATNLYRLYLGDAATLTAAQRKQRPSPGSLKKPVELRIKLKIVQNLLRSKTATEQFPYTVQLVYDALFSETSSAKLKALGQEFIHHICEKCEMTKLTPQASLLLEALIKTTTKSSNESRSKSLGYTAMGKLSLRVPDLFLRNVSIVQDAFRELSTATSQEVKLHVQECLAMMSTAFKDVKPEDVSSIEKIIAQYISDPDHSCRLSAVRHLGKVFPSDHVTSRYLLLLAASDAKEDVGTEAKKLLYGNAASVSESVENEQTKKLPSFADMLNYVYDKAQQRMKSERYVIGVHSLSFPPPTFAVLLQYLRKCLLKDACDVIPHNSIIPGESITEAPIIAEYLGEMYTSGKKAVIAWLTQYLDLILQYARVITDHESVYILLEIIACCPDELSLQTVLGEDLDSKSLVLSGTFLEFYTISSALSRCVRSHLMVNDSPGARRPR